METGRKEEKGGERKKEGDGDRKDGRERWRKGQWKREMGKTQKGTEATKNEGIERKREW